MPQPLRNFSHHRQSLRKLRRRNTLLGALPLSEGSAEKEKAKQRSQWGNGVGAMQLGYAETMRNRDHEQCRNVAYETHYKSWMSFQNLWRTAMKCQTAKTSVQSLWRTACETAERQQDSCLNHAKQRPRTMPKRCLRNALRAEWASKTFGGRQQKLASKAFGRPLAKQPNSSRIRAETMRNRDHEQCRSVAYETH